MNIKQLFCKHAWKTKSVKILNTYETMVFDVKVGEWRQELITDKCVLCGKEKKTVQKKYMHFDTLKNYKENFHHE
jgi:hypothetical protein